MNLAYKKLEEAVKNNEIELFFEMDPKYVIFDYGMRGVAHSIDYYAMLKATNEFIEKHPESVTKIRQSILNVLRLSKIGSIIAIIEMAAYQLNYKQELGFLSEEILTELKKQIEINRNSFTQYESKLYKELDEMAYKNSGMHFM